MMKKMCVLVLILLLGVVSVQGESLNLTVQYTEQVIEDVRSVDEVLDDLIAGKISKDATVELFQFRNLSEGQIGFSKENSSANRVSIGDIDSLEVVKENISGSLTSIDEGKVLIELKIQIGKESPFLIKNMSNGETVYTQRSKDTGQIFHVKSFEMEIGSKSVVYAEIKKSKKITTAQCITVKVQ